jgi:hypothetical protein
MTETAKIADYVIQRLRGEVAIHRYDATSTNSVYLKFDFGVANSLRIADHRGKPHLAYRYNIGLDVKEPYTREQKGYERSFYLPSMVDEVIADILWNKKLKQQKYRDYEAVIQIAREKAKTEPGFWQMARQVA